MGVAPPLRLGLLSTANISVKLLAGVASAPSVEAVAVASRDASRARRFAAEHGLARAHGGYDELLADPDVDAVYVALPNALHAEWALRAVRAGKHVLVEKPLSTDPARVHELFDAADAAGVVVTEGLMWRHQAQVARMAALVAGGEVGELRLVRAAFSFTLDRPADVRWDPALGGGALLDVGTYCVDAARLLAGEPESVAAVATRAPSGADARFAAVMRHPGGVLAAFDCAFDLPYRASLEAIGSDGIVRLPDPWHALAPAV
ncbi:MAG TPA: Gfo/Idh/MocA family oxidoreductase, partial [Solirubrobacteraceae bacterium]|nr:Gfo/Idh/MocA family oxidoreductase [Solirubrobacteraceae bacterium]